MIQKYERDVVAENKHYSVKTTVSDGSLYHQCDELGMSKTNLNVRAWFAEHGLMIDSISQMKELK